MADDDNYETNVTNDDPKKEEEENDNNDNDEFIVINIDDSNGLYLCKERYYTSWNVANLWLKQGTKMDLIVDTGIGLWDFPKFLKQKGLIGGKDGKKPYMAVATHIHFDHSGGLYQFPNAFGIHEQEADAIMNGDNYETVSLITKNEVGGGDSTKFPHKDWKPTEYAVRPAIPERIFQNGDIIDLGGENEIFQVLHLPGHSRGSIVLWNETSGDLFSGDVVYDGLLFDQLPYSNVSDYIQTFQKLVTMSDNVKRVLPGHGDIFDSNKLKEISQTYLDDLGICHTCKTFVGKIFITAFFKGKNATKCC